MGLYLNESGVLTPIAGRGDLTAIRSEMSYLGAKNLLPFDFSHIKKVNGGGTWNGNVYTYRDITYTVNADGTITVDGTASADSIFRVLDTASLAFALNPDKTYYYTGSPATGSSASTYYSYYSELVGGTWTYFMNYGASDTSITPNASATQIVVDIFVKSGETIDNQVFKPMIRLASDPDNTYQPYAMTNKELTESKAKIIYGANLWSANTPVTITLPRLGGLLVGGRSNKGFAIYVCENGSELVVLSGGDFVTASISDLTISLTFSSVYGTSFNWKYINSETGSY